MTCHYYIQIFNSGHPSSNGGNLLSRSNPLVDSKLSLQIETNRPSHAARRPGAANQWRIIEFMKKNHDSPIFSGNDKVCITVVLETPDGSRSRYQRSQPSWTWFSSVLHLRAARGAFCLLRLFSQKPRQENKIVAFVTSASLPRRWPGSGFPATSSALSPPKARQKQRKSSQTLLEESLCLPIGDIQLQVRQANAELLSPKAITKNTLD